MDIHQKAIARSSTGLIQDITGTDFFNLWPKIYGIEAPDKAIEKYLLRRTRTEIELLRYHNKCRLREAKTQELPKRNVTDALRIISRTLCKFETRVFPKEWELPPNCCTALDFPEDYPDGQWIVTLKSRYIVLRESEKSLIGSHLPRAMESNSDKSMFYNAHSFYTKFMEDLVVTFFNCSIKWTFQDEENLDKARLQLPVRGEDDMKRKSDEERERKQKEAKRVRMEAIPSQMSNVEKPNETQFVAGLTKTHCNREETLRGSVQYEEEATGKIRLSSDLEHADQVIDIPGESKEYTGPEKGSVGTSPRNSKTPGDDGIVTISDSSSQEDSDNDSIIFLGEERDDEASENEESSDSDSESVIYDGFHLGSEKTPPASTSHECTDDESVAMVAQTSRNPPEES